MDKILNKIAKLVCSKERKIIIGISGHGASGKTTFANNLIKLIGQSDVNYINIVPYIIGSSNIRKYAVINYEYKNENHYCKMTACHPGAHNISALERDIHMIRDGLDIYTIGTHYKKSNLISSKNKVNIIEGMSVAFANPNLLDLRVYLYTDDETEFTRRSYRDVAERGINIDFLRQSHEERRIQYELFMHPYHQNFDIVLKNSDEEYFLEKDDLIKL
ncbi:uridine kinase [Virgibacillus kekensis]|uniref:Uridine kinase n=1 Tax=Virgibacillus kekensis TaxID=202261 RepID=A0ABV9DNN5_9BACI